MNCTDKYRQNISKNIQDFNNIVRKITEDSASKINTRKAGAEACLETYARVNNSAIYSCTQDVSKK